MTLAAAVAPGCGGIRQCTEYRPVASETAIAATEMPVRRASDEFSPLRTIYPESQKMGNPTMKPVMLIASAACRSPTFRRMKAAITLVLPVCSSKMPKAVPRTMMNPNDFMILPKPSLMALMISGTGSVRPIPPQTKQSGGQKRRVPGISPSTG